ncbi:MAG TPA: DUF6755 family protein [Fimbriimonadaceae bacterium]|nr:DUF6755 family protein [Fimbriimonadaceae bacterium]
MNTPLQFRKEQRTAAFVAILLFAFLLLLIQMWLFVASLDTLLEGRTLLAIPAAVVSLVCFGINAWMLLGLRRMERME